MIIVKKDWESYLETLKGTQDVKLCQDLSHVGHGQGFVDGRVQLGQEHGLYTIVGLVLGHQVHVGGHDAVGVGLGNVCEVGYFFVLTCGSIIEATTDANRVANES